MVQMDSAIAVFLPDKIKFKQTDGAELIAQLFGLKITVGCFVALQSYGILSYISMTICKIVWLIRGLVQLKIFQPH